MIVSGRVYCREDGRGISDVAVTDGTDIAVTGADGRYRLAADPDAEFVYLSLPAGYRIPCEDGSRAVLYRRREPATGRREPATGRREPATGAPHAGEVSTGARSAGFEADFALEPDPAAGDRLSFLYVTDTHLDNQREDRFGSETLAAVSREPSVRFVLFGGDISLQGRAEDAYLQALGGLPIPWFQAIGNHELLVGQSDPKAQFKRLFGPAYYSFNAGRYHFVVLDGTEPDPSRTGWRNVIGKVGERELNWLRRDLAVLPPGTPVICFCHIPLISTYSERRGLLHERAEPSWEITNAAEVLAVFAQYRVQLVLQGHMHENEHQVAGGTLFLTTGAACGRWWRGPNPDGSPRGFRRVELNGDAFRTEYRCLEPVADPHMAVSVAAPEQMIGRPVRVDVNVFDGMPGRDRVFCSAGGRAPWELAPAESVIHRWTGYVPIGETEQRHVLTVTLHRDGNEIARQEVTLAVESWRPDH
jgi:predicted MPP superfamily phosphohydrolase